MRDDIIIVNLVNNITNFFKSTDETFEIITSFRNLANDEIWLSINCNAKNSIIFIDKILINNYNMVISRRNNNSCCVEMSRENYIDIGKDFGIIDDSNIFEEIIEKINKRDGVYAKQNTNNLGDTFYSIEFFNYAHTVSSVILQILSENIDDWRNITLIINKDKTYISFLKDSEFEAFCKDYFKLELESEVEENADSN